MDRDYSAAAGSRRHHQSNKSSFLYSFLNVILQLEAMTFTSSEKLGLELFALVRVFLNMKLVPSLTCKSLHEKKSWDQS